MKASRRGFTVLELVVALLLSALVVHGARELLLALRVSEERLSSRTAEHELYAVGLLGLRDQMANIGPPSEGAFLVDGGERELSVRTWCDSATGLRERCTVRLVLSAVVATQLSVATDHDSLVLPLPFPLTAFRYLDGRDGGTWRQAWGRSNQVPSAIVLVSSLDTLSLLAYSQ